MKVTKESIINRIEELYSRLNEKSRLQNIEMNTMTAAKNKVADYEVEITYITKELNIEKAKLFGLLGEKQ